MCRCLEEQVLPIVDGPESEKLDNPAGTGVLDHRAVMDVGLRSAGHRLGGFPCCPVVYASAQ